MGIRETLGWSEDAEMKENGVSKETLNWQLTKMDVKLGCELSIAIDITFSLL